MNSFSTVGIDRQAIAQRQLNIKNKIRSNPLKWNGQFSPQLVEVLLGKFARSTDIVLDPFVGSGTVLLEASKRGNTAFGSEINPAAYILSNLYSFVNLPQNLRKSSISNIEKSINEIFPSPLFATMKRPIEDKNGLKRSLRHLLEQDNNKREVDLINALIILLDLYQKNISEQKVFATWGRIKHLVNTLPYSSSLAKVFHTDARRIPLPRQSVDLVITSPPYINVFNYHQQYRASAEFLNWNILNAAKSEIGSNRKHRGNRFLTVIQYCLDLAQCLAELQRLCKQDSKLIFVIGRLSTVRGTPFYNGEILAEVFLRSFEVSLDMRQERVFKNRFGQEIFEDILHFSFRDLRQHVNANQLDSARQVAEEVLISALPQSTADTRKDIESALMKLRLVKPSPIYHTLGNLEAS
ncbi:MAG: DNA methyltransferase [Chloroflexota bacterium]|nr:DNA methyltransferase [Chloroflexota bacterium]MDE2952830.1 DNA methyltransferase [Chloroflexota bacterium]